MIAYIDMYSLKHNRYPKTIEELTTSLSLSDDKITNPFNCKYQIAQQENNSKIKVLSLGADCKEGGEGLDADATLLYPLNNPITENVLPYEDTDLNTSTNQRESKNNKPSFTFNPSQSEKISLQLEKRKLLQFLKIIRNYDITVVPYFRSGRQIGIRISTTSIKSKLSDYGIKSDDILLAVNDKLFNMHVEKVLSSIEITDKVTLDVMRKEKFIRIELSTL